MNTVRAILQELDAAEAGGRRLPQMLSEACAAALPVTGVGIALMSVRGPEGLVAATNETARILEDLQFSLGEGPCVDASNFGRPVLAPLMRHTGPARWPGLGPAALDAGVEAVFAFPLQVGAVRLGAMDLYRDAPGELSLDALAHALLFAGAAVQVLLHLQDQMPAGEGLHPDLLAPERDRREVHQATGMVSVQAGVALADALLLLRARAYSEDRSILAVASDVLSRTLRFDDGGEHDEQG